MKKIFIFLKMRLLLRVTMFFFIVASMSVFSQDTHLSQFWISPIITNPAATGFFEGNIRFGAYYRTQWRAISQPYQTVGAYSDFALKKRARQKDIFSMGINVEYDRAGDSKYSTGEANVLFAYAHAINDNNKHFLMGGISLGGVQRTWDYSQLKFDEQYNNGQYDPSTPLSEIFPNKIFYFCDVSAGLQWAYSPNSNALLSVGMSFYHLNRPNISLYKSDNIRLPIQFVAQFNAMFSVGSKTELSPTLFYTKQAQYQEFIFGLTYSFVFHFDSRWYINKFNVGLYHRWRDAIFLSVGGLWRNVHFGLCYDFNVSKLVKASKVRGCFELNASYIIKTHHLHRPKSIPCYLF